MTRIASISQEQEKTEREKRKRDPRAPFGRVLDLDHVCLGSTAQRPADAMYGSVHIHRTDELQTNWTKQLYLAHVFLAAMWHAEHAA